MQPQSDAQLLRAYAEHGVEAAFTKLVQRHTNLVYSAALRQVESPDVAAEISQNVFVSLARGAKTLVPGLAVEASLAGWLCRCSRNLSLNHRRDEFRRQTRERQAMEQLISISDAAPDWEQLRRVLDDAMSELSETDYDALVLRFYQGQDYRTVGATIGVNDDTAQKRVSRALDKLRDLLAHRGVRTTASALSTRILANAVQAAPVGLAVTISATALAGTAVTTSALIAATTKTIAMTTLQKTLVTATVAVLVGTGIYQATQNSQLRKQVQALQEQHAPMTEALTQLQQQLNAATNRTSNPAAQNSSADSARTLAEMLRLRGQVGLLRNQLNSAEAQNRSPAAAVASMINDPAQKEIARMEFQQALHTRYDALVAELQLAPEIADQVGNLMTENELSKKDRMAALIRGDLTVDSALRDRDSAKAQMDTRIKEILGEQSFARLKQYEQAVDAETRVNAINSQMGANALNTEQRQRLQELLTAQPGVVLDDVDLFRPSEALDQMYQEQFERANALLPKAAGFLTPEQAATLATINDNYWNEVRTKLTLYQQLVTNIKQPNQ